MIKSFYWDDGDPVSDLRKYMDQQANQPLNGDHLRQVEDTMRLLDERIAECMGVPSHLLRPSNAPSRDALEQQLSMYGVKDDMDQEVDLRKGGVINIGGTELRFVPHDSVPRGTITAIDFAGPQGDASGMVTMAIEDGIVKVIDSRRIGPVAKPWSDRVHDDMVDAMRGAFAAVRSTPQAEVERTIKASREAYGGQSWNGTGSTSWIMRNGSTIRFGGSPVLRGTEATRWLRTKGPQELRLRSQPEPIHSPWDRQSRKRRKRLARLQQSILRSMKTTSMTWAHKSSASSNGRWV